LWVIIGALVYKFVFCIVCCIIIILSKRHELVGGEGDERGKSIMDFSRFENEFGAKFLSSF
jgi:hypothetical protein